MALERDKDGFYDIPEVGLVPSVTTILSGAYAKPMLVDWAARKEREMVMAAATNLWEDLKLADKSKLGRASYFITLQQRLGQQRAHQRELEKAARIGDQAHALIEWNLRRELGEDAGKEPVISSDAMSVFCGWEKFREDVELEPLMVESVVYSTLLPYAGRFDLLAMMNWQGQRVMAILDWKSGRKLYADCKLQSAAYVQAALEMGIAEYPLAGCVVRFPKVAGDPEFEPKFIPAEEQVKLFHIFQSVYDQWLYVRKEESA